MIVNARDQNVWAIVLVGHADGRVTISPVEAPAELVAVVKAALLTQRAVLSPALK